MHTKVEAHGEGWRVFTYSDPYANGWGVGVSFPSERGAQMVAAAIELAMLDTEKRCADCVESGCATCKHKEI
jgi:hypothetical protein